MTQHNKYLINFEECGNINISTHFGKTDVPTVLSMLSWSFNNTNGGDKSI